MRNFIMNYWGKKIHSKCICMMKSTILGLFLHFYSTLRSFSQSKFKSLSTRTLHHSILLAIDDNLHLSFHITLQTSFYFFGAAQINFCSFFSFICFVLPSNPYSYLIEFSICFEITAICVDHARSISNESTRDKQRKK